MPWEHTLFLLTEIQCINIKQPASLARVRLLRTNAMPQQRKQLTPISDSKAINCILALFGTAARLLLRIIPSGTSALLSLRNILDRRL